MKNEREYKFTIKKEEHSRGKPYIEFKNGYINRGLTLNEISDLYKSCFDMLTKENEWDVLIENGVSRSFLYVNYTKKNKNV